MDALKRLKRGMMGKNGKAVICVSTREAIVKRRLRCHLKTLGFHKTDEGVFAAPGPITSFMGRNPSSPKWFTFINDSGADQAYGSG
jgi:hypothetical protein